MITDIIYNVSILFLMMIPGILLKKCNLISDGFGRGLSNLVLLIAQPALVFLSYLRDFDKEILINCLYILVISIVAHSLFSVSALLLFKKAPVSKGRILKFATVFSNAAFMGIPLIDAVLSDVYPGAVLYASVYNVVFNVFLWSFGVYICTAGKEADDADAYVYSEIYDFTPDEETTVKSRLW